MNGKEEKMQQFFSDDALDVPEMSFLKIKVVYTAASTFYRFAREGRFDIRQLVY